jgi:hypothetical protein
MNFQAVYKLHKRFEQTWSISDLQRSGQPRTAVTDENLQTIAEAFVTSPVKSKRRDSAELGIAWRSLQQILESLKCRLHWWKLLHVLHEDDLDCHTEFCELYCVRNEGDPEFWKSVLWTDRWGDLQIAWASHLLSFCLLCRLKRSLETS